MASLSGVSSSNTMSSLMNSANMISGLASGLDTESMIENLVKSYQTKISQLNQKVTKTEWKQDAYRSIISKMVGFSSKYTSYTSSTNLTSPSFFNSAVKAVTKGEFKDSVTASGKSSSDIALNAVHQLASAAQYRTRSSLVTGDTQAIQGKSMDLFSEADADKIELSNLQGSLTLTYGSKKVSINFSESSTAKDIAAIRAKEPAASDAEVLASYINQKLADEKIVFSSGSSESADQRIKAVANSDGRIVFEEQGTANNGVYISGASGNLAKQLGLSEGDLENAKEKKITVIDTHGIKGENGEKGLTRKLSGIEYLAEKSQAASKSGVKLGMNISLDGSTKQIEMPEVKAADGKYYLNGEEVSKENFAQKYTDALSAEVKKAFGDKVTVENKGKDGALQLEFRMKNEGSDLVVNTGVGEALGIGSTATSYLNTGKTLGELMGDKFGQGWTQAYERDDKGNYKLDADGDKILAKDSKGDPMYDFTINGKAVGSFSKNSTLAEVMTAINGDKDAGVNVSYSKITNNFTFTAKETGADSKIEMGEGLAQAMFGSTEPPDNSSNSFAESYGISWLEGDRTEKITVSIPGHSRAQFSISNKTTIQNVLDELNGDPIGKDHTFAYNKYSGQIEAKNKKTGEAVEFKMTDSWDDDVVFDKTKGPNIDYTAGQDAKFTVTVNGEQKTMTRSSNSVNIDGLTINMEETFSAAKTDENGNEIKGADGKVVYDPKKAVTFQSKTDSDKIVDAIKKMADEYNTMMAEIKSAYGTMPYRKSSGSFANYEPLTDEERDGMSESAIERYEEKAKQGILFGDRNLSGLYTKMSQVFSFSNQDDVNTLKDMGIGLSFNISDGAQALTVDEDKLRAMLDSDPDRVADLFTKKDGIMDRMKTQLDNYAKTTGEPKGILIEQAGSPLSSLSLMSNSWQKEIDNLNTQIEKWQDKLTSQVERYTSQFSRLEQLINQMNSQSSTLAGLMGGG